MRLPEHSLTTATLIRAMNKAPSDEVILEHAWRTLRVDPENALAVAKSMAQAENPTLAARARVLGTMMALRQGASLAPREERHVDESILGAVWALRSQNVFCSAALTHYLQDEAELHHLEIQRLYQANRSHLPEIDLAWISGTLGRFAYRQGDLAEARRRFIVAARGYRTIGLTTSEAICLTNLGNVLSDLGDAPGALKGYTGALSLLSGRPDSRFASALAHANIAVVRGHLDDADEARRYAELALASLIPADGPAAPINTLALLTDIELTQGRIDAAERCLDRSQAILGDSKSRALVSHIVRGRALVLSARGDPAAGLALLDQPRATPDERTAVYEIAVRAKLLDALARSEEVVSLLGDEMPRNRAMSPSDAAELTQILIRAYVAVGDAPAALATLQDHLAWSDARHRRLNRMHASERAVELDLEAADARERAARQDAELLYTQLVKAQRLEAVGRLASGIAHDFNNMLMIVMAEAGLMNEYAGTTQEVRDSADQILQAAERGHSVTKRLLAFASQKPFISEPVELNGVVEALNHMLKTACGARIRLSVIPAAQRVTVLADVGILEQMILNLVLNARDAMRDGGDLTVLVGLSEGHGYVRVEDTGCGIAEDLLPRIFDPFFTTKGPDEGTGLGLSMVFGGMEQLGGTVAVESTLGKGTAFTLQFKLYEPSIQAD
jgi:signal transduction histidine kinase